MLFMSPWTLLNVLLVWIKVPVQGKPMGTNVTGSSDDSSKSPPVPSYLLEDSQKVNFTLLDPIQLMNSTADCDAFTNGTSKYEFSSPNYPKKYPDNIDCIKIIEAGEGEVVLVQFYDFFHVEASSSDRSMDCPYDYLEVRFGKFGYSELLGKICGKQPPTLTKSTGRYMWLRFHSDATVSYRGFRAAIQFVPDNSEKPEFGPCIKEIGGIEGDIISNKEIPMNYLQHAQKEQNLVDCTWVIQAPPGYKIFFRMHVYELEQPNSCIHNAIEVYDSYAKLAGRAPTPPHKFCGSQQQEAFKSGDNVLAIRLTTKVGPKSLDSPDLKKLSHFHANYTRIRELETNKTLLNGPAQECDEDEFDCSDNTCIPLSLKCNDRVNCQLKNDEEKCPDLKQEGLKADIITIAFLGALLVVGMCTGMFLNIFRKLKQDRQEIQAMRALQRKSRESGLVSEAQSQKSLCISEQNHQGPSRPVTTIEEQSSTESKDTVIHKPLPATIESTKRHQAEQTNNLPGYDAAAPYPSMGFMVPAPAPPPPVPPTLQLNQQRKILSRRASDIPSVPKGNLQVAIYRKPSEPVEELQRPPAPILVPMQFVRDCACQTRESYLMARRHSMLRAPLARAEAIEFFQGTPVRRLSRPTTPITTYFPPSSASSEIGNSLERLDEEFE